MSAAIAEDCNNVNLDEVHLCALSASTRNLLCNLLNTPKLIPSEDNHLRDWRGLAQLIGVPAPSNSNNPTDCVINTWMFLEEGPRPTVGKLLSFLGQIDRWDVHDDMKHIMENDAKRDLGVNNSSIATPSSDIKENDVITVDDLCRYNQGLPLQTYDAFFLYVEEDASFAKEIVAILEGDFGMRLCLRDRDLVGGLMFTHDAIMRLIANRCSQLIVIISEHFINSEEHKFFFKYAQALSIYQGKRKIIPLVRNACGLEVPHEFKFYFLLDLSRHASMRTFCDRLKNSIKPSQVMPALPAPSVLDSRCTIEEIPPEMHTKISISSKPAQIDTVVVQMPDPSAFLSPDKSKLDVEVCEDVGATSSKSESKTSVSKPLSPAVKMRNIFRPRKNPSLGTNSNGNAQPKTKKGKSWIQSKKKVPVAEL